LPPGCITRIPPFERGPHGSAQRSAMPTNRQHRFGKRYDPAFEPTFVCARMHGSILSCLCYSQRTPGRRELEQNGSVKTSNHYAAVYCRLSLQRTAENTSVEITVLRIAIVGTGFCYFIHHRQSVPYRFFRDCLPILVAPIDEIRRQRRPWPTRRPVSYGRPLYLVFQLDARSPGLVRLLHIFSPLSDAVLSLKWQDSNWNFPAGPSSLILSHDRFPAIIADQIERNSERDNVLEEKQAEVVHVMDAVNHDGVIRSRDQHGTCGEEHAD
jgi:hypothetical protein